MANILDIARYADVSAESVLRVVSGEPVSEDIAQRVQAAIDALGPPVEVLPAAPAGPRAPETRHDELLQRFAQAAAELEAILPQGVGSVIYEALRVEVRPVARHIEQLGALFEQLVRRLEQVGGDVSVERRERVEDVALLTELITTGWRTVDRRLGRLERILARLEDRKTGDDPSGNLIRFEADYAGRQEAVEDLEKRLEFAIVKMEAASKPKPPRPAKAVTVTSTKSGKIEKLICAECGSTFERLLTRGPKPHTCPACRGSSRI